MEMGLTRGEEHDLITSCPINGSTRLRRQDLSNRGRGKESLILQIRKPALGKLFQVMFQSRKHVSARASLVIPIDVLNDPQIVVPK